MNDHNLEAERAAPELLDCPFCGGTAEVYPGKVSGAHIGCTICRAETFGMTEELAVTAWNRRHPAVGEDGLPPLPEDRYSLWLQHGQVVNCFTHGCGDPAIWDHDKHWEKKGYSRAPLYTAEQYRQGQRDAIAADRRARDAESDLPPVEYDRDMDRTYIPLPAGWEIQTKGNGSSFRIVHAQQQTRWIVMDDRLHEPLEGMARDIRNALAGKDREIADLRAQLARKSQEDDVCG